MEKELNIAAILKDKPEKTILHDIMRRINVSLYNVERQRGYTNVFCEGLDEFTGFNFVYSDTGSDSTWRDGLQILKPSKEMQDWSKFAWKKGDVLCSKTGDSCIFIKWLSDDYTSFLGYYSTHKNYENEECQTEIWSKNTNKEDIEQYILAIEAIKGGTLNLSTLQIEQPKQEFKDGDIFTLEESYFYIKTIGIFKGYNEEERIKVYAAYNVGRDIDYINVATYDRPIRLSTDSEKQQLIDALAKDGKRWNPDTKQIEDLPKKCELKPFDKVLIKDHNDERWEIDFFAYYDEVNQICITTSGNSWNFCIPYNDSTKHLLGTTDEWEGGEG